MRKAVGRNEAVGSRQSAVGYLSGDRALASIVLWASGRFDTAAIAELLSVREDAVWRTIHDAKDTAAGRRTRLPTADCRLPAGKAGE